MDVITFIIERPFTAFVILFISYALLFTCYHQSKLRWLAYLGAVPFLVYDFLINMFVFTMIGFELPREWLVTQRLQRWKRLEPNSVLKNWRSAVAWALCGIMNRFDEDHC